MSLDLSAVDPWAWAARLVQYAGAVVLFGWPLFGLYAAPVGRSLRPLAVAAAAVCAGGVVALAAAAASMSGEAKAGMDPAAWAAVLTGTEFGRGLAARVALALAAGLVTAFSGNSRTGAWLASGLGAAVLASFAWTGHGAEGEGAAGLVHRLADIAHLLAAGVWLGALAALARLAGRAVRSSSGDSAACLGEGLTRFSGIGVWVVGVLSATGLVNAWAIVGHARPADILRSAYGLALALKLMLFAAMLALAATNRWAIGPRLAKARAGGDDDHGAGTAFACVAAEAVLGLAVLAAVAALGLVPPPGHD